MGLGTRELLLVLRARDEASRVLRQIGGNIHGLSEETATAARKQIAQGAALATVGVGIAMAGAKGIQFFYDAALAAQEYNRQSALTKTQVDKVGVSLDTIKQIGRDVAKAIPAPFEEMQSMLYDIFSSMDVSVSGAKILLTEFSKAAVAGQVDLQQAGRATISIMNAWHMPATKVNEVNDLMFQLVRKGVGTYDEFSRAIGRAIPSTTRAGQSFQTLGAMMAFMTRNGLSTQQAATSAARAMDAIANPKTLEHMESLKIKFKDAKGEMLPLPDILHNIQAKMKGMTGPERNSFITQLFKGSGGTIQARRFFDLVFKNMGDFDARVKDMENAGGAMSDAYKTMADTAAAKLQLLKNKWGVLKTEIGDVFLPVLNKVRDGLLKVVTWFSNLDPKMQRIIIIAAGLTAVFAVLMGIGLIIAGGWMMLAGAATLAGIAMSSVIAIIVGVIAGFVAVGVAIWAIIKYHEQLMTWFKAAWGVIKPFLDPIIVQLQNLWTALKVQLQPAWESLKQTWDTIAKSELLNILKALGALILFTLVTAVLALIAAFSAVVTFIGNVLPPVINAVAAILNNLVGIVVGVFNFIYHIVTGQWGKAWEDVKSILSNAVGLIWNVLKGAVTIIWGVIKGLVMGVINFFLYLLDVLVGHSIIPDMIMSIVRWFATLPFKVLAAVASLVGSVTSWAGRVMLNILNKFISGGSNLMTYVRGLIPRIVGAINGFASSMWNAGANIMKNLYQGLQSWAGRVLDSVRSVAQQIRNLWPFSPAKAGPLRRYPMNKAGMNLMKMLASGIDSGQDLVVNAMSRAAGNVTEQSGGGAPVVSGLAGTARSGSQDSGVQQTFNIHTQEIDPVRHSSELGFRIAARRG